MPPLTSQKFMFPTFCFYSSACYCFRLSGLRIRSKEKVEEGGGKKTFENEKQLHT
jgi:hypothetical protein